MIDRAYWSVTVCDLCRKDESLLEPRLVGLMENGYWVNGYSKEIVEKCRAIRAQWEKDITCPCITFDADMDSVVICEKHLNEIIAKKDV